MLLEILLSLLFSLNLLLKLCCDLSLWLQPIPSQALSSCPLINVHESLVFCRVVWHCVVKQGAAAGHGLVAVTLWKYPVCDG